MVDRDMMNKFQRHEEAVKERRRGVAPKQKASAAAKTRFEAEAAKVYAEENLNPFQRKEKIKRLQHQFLAEENA